MFSTKIEFLMMLPCIIGFGRLILSNGLILDHWRLTPIFCVGSSQELVLLYTFLRLVKLPLCSFIYLYLFLSFFFLFSFVLIIGNNSLVFPLCSRILNKGWGSCNFCIEESVRCLEHSSCFKHLPGWTLCDIGWYYYDMQLGYGI